MATRQSQDPFESLTRTTAGVVYLRPCVDIVCYWRGSAFDRVEPILAFYRRAVQGIGASVTHFQTDSMGAPAPLREGTLELLEFWLTGTKSRRDVYLLQLESSAARDDVSDRAVSFQATEAGDEEATGFIRLVLPASFGELHAPRLLELAAGLFDGGAFNFGQAGYALNWNEFGRFSEQARDAMGAMRGHHPGLDLSDPGSSQYVAAGSIKCVNWLTMLGSAACARLGGLEALSERCAGTEVVAHALTQGVLVQAGATPELGDTNRRRTAPAYRAAGRLLAPLRDDEHPPFLSIGGVDDDEATLEWLARFDR